MDNETRLTLLRMGLEQIPVEGLQRILDYKGTMFLEGGICNPKTGDL